MDYGAITGTIVDCVKKFIPKEWAWRLYIHFPGCWRSTVRGTAVGENNTCGDIWYLVRIFYDAVSIQSYSESDLGHLPLKVTYLCMHFRMHCTFFQGEGAETWAALACSQNISVFNLDETNNLGLTKIPHSPKTSTDPCLQYKTCHFCIICVIHI